jgi:hypothetical protein
MARLLILDNLALVGFELIEFHDCFLDFFPRFLPASFVLFVTHQDSNQLE